ncbi:tripartite tricarboxylate transporter substrate binding protein [Achromobacter sp. GG226]|uniref:Bug family tripartite tricarboxylate transporter substrate binding protein n=1 Tax=Verticiella alkaliphila TaxID=2779529 RepID=UPI001C0AD4A8|nr:tripartite tricarboxylate transporter substrate binding protein [Verticiella sp. GG226]MBU4611441.1 tripartite tricarboxylate transporter substrate binding protein [Verticiella sp. GG226]
MTRTPLRLATCLAAVLATTTPALAADLSAQPITIIVPYAPGGSSDAVARHLQQPLAAALNTTVIVDNKPGGNGAIGASQLARSKADGHTILIGALGMMAINEGLYPNLTYQPERDFDMLTVAVQTPNAIVVNPKSDVKTLPELLAHLKENPGKVSFASSGTGSSEHLTMELFWQNSQTDGIHVPYKGGGPAITDTMAGHADVLFSNLGAVAPHIQSERLRLVAVTGAERNPLFPDTPVPGEAGVPGMEVYSWQGIAAPKGLPDDVRTQLNQALVSVLTSDDFRQKMDKIGFQVVANSPEEATAYQREEAARWKKVIDAGNVSPE